MIDVRELSKSYGDVEALRQVSFSVRPGEVIGLLGPNGAGKTTLMKILTGFLHPTSGTALVGGLDVLENQEKVQEQIGYLPENAPLYPELTVQSYLRMMAELRRIPQSERPARLAEAIRAVGLEDRLTQTIGTLSKGYRQRVGLAQAILHRPRLLILDEPTNGLDPTQIVEVRRLIRDFGRHSTVIVSTHNLFEVEATCDRAIILIRGEIRADAKLATLAASAAAVVSLLEPPPDGEVIAALSSLKGVSVVEKTGEHEGASTFRVHGAASRALCPEIYGLARERNWLVSELRQDARTLEAVFHDLAQSEGGGF